MDKKKLDYFKGLLLRQKQLILNGSLLKNSEDLHVAQEDLSDETDLASSLVAQQLSCSMREREIIKLKKIDLALERIEGGHYGHCEECDEEINVKRLETQPWTVLCITHAEEKERSETQIFRQQA